MSRQLHSRPRSKVAERSKLTRAESSPGVAVQCQTIMNNQRTRDIENLRVTIKILERQDREIELETARFFLHEMKIKNPQPNGTAQTKLILHRACSALVRVWRAQAKLTSKHIQREEDRIAEKGLRAYASGLTQCADQLSDMLEDLAPNDHAPGSDDGAQK